MAIPFDEVVRKHSSPAVRERGMRLARELMAEMLLSELRRSSGMSQRELAAALGIKQPSLSKLEKQSDMQITTLRRIVEALGGELHLVVKLRRGTTRIDQFDVPVKSRRVLRPRARKAA